MQKPEEDKALATSGPAEKDKAVATSGSVEEDNAVATSESTTMQGEAVADPEHNYDQASTAVAVSTSAEKPAMGLVSATSSLNTNELTWVINTGATSHMCKDIGLFVTFEPLESSIDTAANPLRILEKGTVHFPVKDATNAVRSVELTDVNYVPRVAHNLFSVIKALVNDEFKINRVDLHFLRDIGKRECALLANENANTKEALWWNRRAGHPGVECNASTRLPFSKAIPKTATCPGEVFYTDIGVLPTSTFSGYRYFIVFVDEYTRYVFTFLMRKRDEVYHVYKALRRKIKEKIKYIYTVVSEYDDDIKRVQSDNGKEYEKLARIIAKSDTHFRVTQTYTPQQNGITDSHGDGEAPMPAVWRTFIRCPVGRGRDDLNLPDQITPSAAIDMRSPYLLWHNGLPRITKLRTFGCAAYAWIPKDKRTKLEAHAVKCIFVGYDEEDRSGYRLLRLLDCEVIQSRDARFNEAEFPMFADRVLTVLPDERQPLCGCYHCDDHLAKATASVEAILLMRIP
ncbi:unnamed protein product [Phytophthora fragariaefolia]|uniref:Unnamed protein product n=1 Tax=Phytophthora fragariaefolia TaxID=1490495 RepID=A0A9W7CXF0_9STRA|nr:unnamed protein product [Phytophthora fragariaefolia]